MNTTSTVARLLGVNYVTVSGDVVVSNLMSQPLQVGDVVVYAKARSVKTVRLGGRSNSWTEQRSSGNTFFKQV